LSNLSGSHCTDTQHTALKPKVDTSNILSSRGRKSETMLQEASVPNSNFSLHRGIDSCPVRLTMHYLFTLSCIHIVQPVKSPCCTYMPLYIYTEYISFVQTVQTPLHSPVHLPKLHPAVVSMRFPLSHCMCLQYS